MPNSIHILSLSLCLLLVTTTGKAGMQPNSNKNLKDLVCRITQDNNYRRTLQIREPGLLQEFYEANGYTLQWYSSVQGTINRTQISRLISSAEFYMLETATYQRPFTSPNKKLTTWTDTLLAEISFTDAALSFLQDISYPGDQMVKYNGWNYKPACAATSSILQQALKNGNFEAAIRLAEPDNIPYQKLKETYGQLYAAVNTTGFKEIIIQNRNVSTSNTNLVEKLKQLNYLAAKDTGTASVLIGLKKLQVAHNLPAQNIISNACLEVLNESLNHKLRELRWNVRWYRWLNCMQNHSYLLVNIAANRLSLMRYNEESISCKIVVGKTSTPSPTLTSCIDHVIYYPYWNVPHSIAVKEMLPRLKRNPRYLDGLQIEVLRGNKIYESSSNINWHQYSARNFPFNLRQLPGCKNSLGRLKFDFENPFSVYLHDTNNKLAFISFKRFFSHGCIRVEKPYELALALGVSPLKVNMDSCLTEMKPQSVPLQLPIPVFIIYATIDVQNGELRWFEDAYHKMEN